METWKPIDGFEGQYEISSEGGVKSLSRVVLTKARVSGENTRITNQKQKESFYEHKFF